MSSFLYRIGRASYRRRRRVLAAWLVVIAVLGALALTAGGAYNDAFKIPGAESTEALAEMAVTFPEAADATASILITVPEGKRLTDSGVKLAVEDWSKRMEQLPWVNGLIGPYSDYVDGLISPDGRSGRVMARVDGTISTFSDQQRAELTATAESLQDDLPGTRVLVGGEVFAVNMPHITAVEALGLVVALVVLMVTLGSVVASMMPIVTALTGVGIGVLIVQLGAGLIDVSSTTLMLAVMLGVAVGIDYALFIIARHRDQLAEGLEVEESAARAIGTAGSAVVFAGLTVIIALIGLSISGVPFLAVMGIFAAVTVAFAVVLALTLLPALMGFAGERLRPKTKSAGRTAKNQATKNEAAKNGVAEDDEPAGETAAPVRSTGAPRFNPSAWWVRTVTKWPVVTIVIVLTGLGALALPTQDLYLALPTSGRSLPGTQDRETFDEISKVFGVGYNGPLVVTGSIVESDEPLKIMDCLRDDIEKLPGVEMVASATPNQNADTGMVQIIPTTGPDDPATADLVHELRSRHDYWQRTCGIDTAITGFTAVQIDVTERLGAALLPFGIFVVGLSLVLLTLVFRSIWVPIKAAAGYLLSVGGAFGATTLVFNQGWFASVINLPEPGPVISFLPIILMGLLFGLAMDYEVFLVSRMREEFVHGNTEHSIEDGFVHSAKVVVAAAAIMFFVFAFFVPSGQGPIKPIAFALAVGVALDAFVVRMTLVPAVMKLLGRHAWWLPAWLDKRLPSLDIEGESLTRQVRLVNWPAPGDAAAIVGEGLSAGIGERILFTDLALRVEPGGVLVVEGEHASRRALLLALAGRLKLTQGTLKVLGRVLPEEAPLIRSRIPVLDAEVAHFGRILKRQSGGLVVVDDVDELSGVQARSLRRALTAAAAAAGSPDLEPITWVLGANPGSPLETQLQVPYEVLRLPSHLALEGANR